MSDDEVRLVWHACEAIGYPFGECDQLLLLTGQRLREVAGIQWDELNSDLTEWEIPGSRTKNGKPHLLPLSDLATGILKGILEADLDRRLVFTTNGKSAISGFSKSKARLDSEIATGNAGVRLPAWVRHDVRRTVATGCQSLGIPIDHTEAMLNHSGGRASLVSVYQRYKYHAEKLTAMQRWADKVKTIVA